MKQSMGNHKQCSHSLAMFTAAAAGLLCLGSGHKSDPQDHAQCPITHPDHIRLKGTVTVKALLVSCCCSASTHIGMQSSRVGLDLTEMCIAILTCFGGGGELNTLSAPEQGIVGADAAGCLTPDSRFPLLLLAPPEHLPLSR